MRLALVALSAVLSDAIYPACPTGLKCITITPPDEPSLTFDCATIAGASPQVGNVYFMHGNTGKNSKAIFAQTMLALAPLGYTGLACDQRGYSPGANPSNLNDYNYDKLAQDIFSIVNAFGFDSQYSGKFHVVAHDQGARVAWHSIARTKQEQLKGNLGSNRYLSFTSLSIPHADVFSDALYGPSPTLAQQNAAQYVRELTIPDSVTLQNNLMANKLCHNEGWTNYTQCQHTLWWYNGAIDSGAMALAPWYTLLKGGQEGSAIEWLGLSPTSIVNLTVYPLEGVPQKLKVGDVSDFPVFYACGTEDSADLCLSKFGEESGQLITDFTYMQVADCGHNVLMCSNATQVSKLIKTIVLNIQSIDTSTTDSSSTFTVGVNTSSGNTSSSLSSGRRLHPSELVPKADHDHQLMLRIATRRAIENSRSTTGVGTRGASCNADIKSSQRLVGSSEEIITEEEENGSVRVIVVSSSPACNEAVKHVVNHHSAVFETNLNHHYQQLALSQGHRVYLQSGAVNGGTQAHVAEQNCYAEDATYTQVLVVMGIFIGILVALACCTWIRRVMPADVAKQMHAR